MKIDNKFIITKDRDIADKMTLSGFVLVSQFNNVFTFINEPPKNFIFSNFELSKIVYTNNLSI